MTFFSIDDRLYGHPKFAQAGLGATGLWLLAGAWVSAFDEDGLIPSWLPSSIMAGRPGPDSVEELVARLVEARLWEPQGDGGWLMHDWDDWNLTAEQRARRRRLATKRQQDWRRKAKLKAAAEQEDQAGRGHQDGKGDR